MHRIGFSLASIGASSSGTAFLPACMVYIIIHLTVLLVPDSLEFSLNWLPPVFYAWRQFFNHSEMP